MKLDYCPKCGDDMPIITSCAEYRESEVTCHCCGYQVRRNWPEDKISEYWNSLRRKPADVLAAKFA